MLGPNQGGQVIEPVIRILTRPWVPSRTELVQQKQRAHDVGVDDVSAVPGATMLRTPESGAEGTTG